MESKQTNKNPPDSQKKKKRVDLWLPEVGAMGGGEGSEEDSNKV